MDYEFWTRLLLNDVTVKRVSRILSSTRIHEATKTSTGGLAFIEEILEMQRDHFDAASPIWLLYERTRTVPVSNISNKYARFGVGIAQMLLKQPTFVVAAIGSMIERTKSDYRARRLLRSVQ